MLSKTVDKITFEDLNKLKENQVAEDKRLDYKRELPKFLLIPGNNEEAKKAKKPHKIEFLKDVSAFANTSGGYLLYGIKSENGVPTEISGVDSENKEDAYILQLNETLDSQLEPRIASGSRDLAFVSLEEPKKEKVLAIYVSKSWRAPHRIKLNNHFYKRSATQNPPMDVDDLRVAFSQRDSLTKSARQFRNQRINELYTFGMTPVDFRPTHANPDKFRAGLPSVNHLLGGTQVVLHLVPIDAFTPAKYIDLKKAKDDPRQLLPIGTSEGGMIVRPNIDGFLVAYLDDEGYTHSYAQLYRNGIIEAVEGGALIDVNELVGNVKTIWIKEFETDLRNALQRYLKLLQTLEVDVPLFLFLTLLGVEGVGLYYKGMFPPRVAHTIDRSQLSIPEACVKSYVQTPNEVLKGIFEALWNACGKERPKSFSVV